MLKRTPFYELHKKAGAKLIDFGGFDMPVQYESIRKEHKAVRENVGIFDVSHMGEFYVSGSQAFELVQKMTINDVARLQPGKAQYSAMCYEDGGMVDDLLVYMLAEDEYILVVNASNIEKDFNWIAKHNSFDAELADLSEDTCLLAVQGPRSVETLQKLTETDLSSVSFYTFNMGQLAGFDDITFSATGYTGEKGFELYFNKNRVNPAAVWEAIMDAGSEFGIEPCGLGARDTLRLEMGYALYGNDITEDTHPLEAGMGWLTRLDKDDFIGREALIRAREEGLERRLVGFVVEDRRSIPRKGYTLYDSEDQEIGFVTSGTRSITLNENIGMGYVKEPYSEEGSAVFVEVRNKKSRAIVKKPPFVKK
ncbi:glycine cleavage system aminomethyltransferase GcvT [Fodinibius sediminis]|uniref:Aminomethyltransferase n=1 Tax=Fodinibius sediminis TaxID=1214077 RepID=A0A521AQB3_9BACT|nr:glycine cleavage system aminomethyltransferase GcvT [Fodinibius sediminis]SMO36951.1 aminomethyltransferase [Fodinibius sediminis]